VAGVNVHVIQTFGLDQYGWCRYCASPGLRLPSLSYCYLCSLVYSSLPFYLLTGMNGIIGDIRCYLFSTHLVFVSVVPLIVQCAYLDQHV